MTEDQPRVGPKAAEDEIPLPSRKQGRGLAMRAVVPNAITAAAMCSAAGARGSTQLGWTSSSYGRGMCPTYRAGLTTRPERGWNGPGGLVS